MLTVPALECNVAEHCNLRCAGCDHASPLRPARFVTRDRFEADVEALAPHVRVGEFKLLGGEPLLHPDLTELAASVQRSGVARRVVVVSNGTLLHRAPSTLWEHVDLLRVTVYPGIRIACDLDALPRQLAAREVDVEVERVHSFRRTLLAEPRASARRTQRVYGQCRLAREWSCHTLRDGRLYLCPPSALGPPAELDESVDLHDPEGLEERIAALLARREPLAACRSCLGSSGMTMAHRQLTQQEVAAGIDETHTAPDRSRGWWYRWARPAPRVRV